MNKARIIAALQGKLLVQYQLWNCTTKCGCAVGTLLEAAGENEEMIRYSNTPNVHQLQRLNEEYGLTGRQVMRLIKLNDGFIGSATQRTAYITQAVQEEAMLHA